ncbi:MAG: hypothetical protein ACRCTE_13785 [Cellulosilyticaceae bacterium]
MALEISITPTLSDFGNGVPTTTVVGVVDVTSIAHLLNKYNLIMKVVLAVKNIDGTRSTYEFTQIYRNIITSTIRFEMMVVGQFTDTSNMSGTALGGLINK